MPSKDRVLIYGATGYMGRLLARAAEGHFPVVLAARNSQRLARFAEELDMPYRSFPLQTPAERERRSKEEARRWAQGRAERTLRRLEIAERVPAPETTPSWQRESPNAALYGALEDVCVVVNAAGPFGQTALELAKACIKTQTHYVDISGEYEVLSAIDDLDDLARKQGVCVAPGVGLTVLASDLLTRMAVGEGRRRGMDTPHTVRVALSRVPIVSRGSVKTMLEAVRDGARLIRNGKYERAPAGSLVRNFSFGADAKFVDEDVRACTALTLADLLTARYTAARAWTTGAAVDVPWADVPPIPNAETYVEASAIERLSFELGGELALALRSRPLKSMLARAADFFPEGPPAEERSESPQQVVVELEDRYRAGVQIRLRTENSYDFTVRAALLAADLLRKGRAGVTGFQSPGWINGMHEVIRDALREVTYLGLAR